jgi:hypothetical protein
MSTAHADEKTLFLKDFSAPTACRTATFAMVKQARETLRLVLTHRRFSN